MKKFWVDFIKRGLAFAWGGPVIICIIWLCLEKSGQLEALSVSTAVWEVLSCMLVAFIAAGISVIHQQEHLPLAMRTLIQMGVLYIDYLVIYLLNGWLSIDAIGIFSAIFFACFALIWLIILLVVKAQAKRFNARLAQRTDLQPPFTTI